MRPLRLVLLTLGCAASLLLGGAVAVLWVRGQWVGDTFIFTVTSEAPPRWHVHFVQIWSNGGGLRVMAATIDAVYLPAHERRGVPDRFFRHGSYTPGPKPYPINRYDGESWTAGGFEYFWKNYATNNRDYVTWERSITAPSWLFLVCFAVIPAWCVVKLRRAVIRRRRRLRGLCARCGYDLRASADRCPECGAPAESHGLALSPAGGSIAPAAES